MAAPAEPDPAGLLQAALAWLGPRPAAPPAAHDVPRALRGLDRATARAVLVDVVDELQAAGQVSIRDRDIWVATVGLDGWRHRRVTIAARYAVSAARVDQIRARVTQLVAAALVARDPAPGRGGVLRVGTSRGLVLPDAGDHELAIARVHGEVALVAPRTAPERAGIEVLRRERLGTGRPTRRTTTSPRERAARSRARRRLEARVMQVLHAPVDVPPRLLSPPGCGLGDVLDDGWTSDPPDLDRLRALVPAGTRFPPSPWEEAAALLAVRGFTRWERSPDPGVEARAWLTAGLGWITRREPAALLAFVRAAELAGATPTGVRARMFHAIALRHHGYLWAARRVAAQARTLVGELRVDSATAAELHQQVLLGYATASPFYLRGADPVPILAEARERLVELLALADGPGGTEQAAAVARRRLLMTDHLLAVTAARDEGRRRVVWSAGLRRRVEEAELAHSGAAPFDRVNWLLTQARLALDVGDAAWWADAAAAFSAAQAAPGRPPMLVTDMRVLAEQASARRLRSWRAAAAGLPDEARALLLDDVREGVAAPARGHRRGDRNILAESHAIATS